MRLWRGPADEARKNEEQQNNLQCVIDDRSHAGENALNVFRFHPGKGFAAVQTFIAAANYGSSHIAARTAASPQRLQQSASR